MSPTRGVVHRNGKGRGPAAGPKKEKLGLGVGARTVSVPEVAKLYPDPAARRDDSGSWSPGQSLPQWTVPAEVHLPHVTTLTQSRATTVARRTGSGQSSLNGAGRVGGGTRSYPTRSPSAPPGTHQVGTTTSLPALSPVVAHLSSALVTQSPMPVVRRLTSSFGSVATGVPSLLDRESIVPAAGLHDHRVVAGTRASATKPLPLPTQVLASPPSSPPPPAVFMSENNVHNADDVLAYYAYHGDDAPVPHFYLEPRHDRTGLLRDYVVVPKYKIGLEYCVFSARGVVSVRYGGTPEEESHFELLQEWYRVFMSTRLLLQIHFFRAFRVIKAFAKWKKFIRWHRFCQARISFVKSSLLFQDTLRASILEIWGLCGTYKSVSMFRSCVRAGTFYTHDNFKATQRSQRIKAVVHYQDTMAKIKVVVFHGCSSIKKQLAARDIHLENQVLRRQQTDIAFRKGASRSLPIEDELAAEDQALHVDSLRAHCVNGWDGTTFVRFIRLCHFMINESMLSLGFDVVEMVKTEFATPPPQRTAVLLISMVKDHAGRIVLERVEDQIKKTVGTLLKEAMYTLATQPSLLQVSKLQKLLKANRNGVPLSKPLSVLDVVPKSPEYVETQRTLEELLLHDYLLAPTFVKQYSEMEALQIKLDAGAFRAIAANHNNLNEALFRENLNNGQDNLRLLDRIKTVQQCGILALTCRELKSGLYERVYAEIQFVKDTILEYMWQRCIASLTELHDMTKTLGKTPNRLSEYVNYVTMFNAANLEARPRLATVMQEVLQMRTMCTRYQVVMSAQLLVKLDDLPVASLNFKTTLKKREEEVVTLMRPEFMTILDNKLSKLEEVLRNARAQLTEIGAFDNSGLLVTTVIAKLNFFRDGIADKLDKLETHVNYQRALGVLPRSLDAGIETLEVADRLCRIWKLYALWQRYETNVHQDYFIRLEQSLLYGAYIFFHQRLKAISADASTHAVVRHMRRLMTEWRKRLPVILAVTSPHWNLDMWERTFTALDLEFSANTPFTLMDLDNKGMFDGQVVEAIDSFMSDYEAGSQVWSTALEAAEAKAHTSFHSRALIALTNEQQIATLQASLSALHFVEITVVSNGAAVMAHLEEAGAVYDLLIVDIALAGSGALELGEQIRAITNRNVCNPGIPIFALPEVQPEDDAMAQFSSAAQAANLNLILSPAHLDIADLQPEVETHIVGWIEYDRQIKAKARRKKTKG